MVAFAGVTVYGLAAAASPAVIAAGAVGLAFSALFARGARDRLRGDRIALMRDGDVLIGGELQRPLPASDATFAIESDHQGSWVIVLNAGSEDPVRLSAGGWALDGERFVTFKVAEQALLGMGLTRQR